MKSNMKIIDFRALNPFGSGNESLFFATLQRIDKESYALEKLETGELTEIPEGSYNEFGSVYSDGFAHVISIIQKELNWDSCALNEVKSPSALVVV